MGKLLTLEIRDDVYATLEQQAETAGTSAERLAATMLEREFAVTTPDQIQLDPQAARERFEQHFGEIDLGHATGADNDSIDADLAREYDNDHREV